METQEALTPRQRARMACRKWYEKNRDKVLPKKRVYMADRRKNVPRVLADIKKKSYQRRDPVAYLEQRRLYRKTERYKLVRREWKARNYHKVMWVNAKQRAKRFGLEFTIGPNDIVIPAICPVLGIPLVIGLNKTADNSPSLDRFDNNLGYTKENIRVISYRANILKRDATSAELKAIVSYMEGDK